MASSLDDNHRTSMKLIHDGKFAKLLPFMPRVSTVTLSDGWSSEMVNEFPLVIDKVVAMNPILTGRVMKNGKGVFVKMAAFRVAEHSFGNVHDFVGKTPSVEGMTKAELLDFVENNINTFIAEKCRNTIGSSKSLNVGVEIKHGLPLFEANLFRLDQSTCAYHISMSHAVGDAATYYMLIDQIACLLNGNDVNHRINWDNEILTSHELHAPNLNEKDIKRARWSLFGIILKSITGGKRKSNYIFLDPKAIDQKKIEMVGSENKYLSSNDVIIAAICRISNKSNKAVLTTMDMRSRKQNILTTDGGNALSQFAMPIHQGKNPNIVRQSIDKMHYYPPGKTRLSPIIRGNYVPTSNWSSVSPAISLVPTRMSLRDSHFLHRSLTHS